MLLVTVQVASGAPELMDILLAVMQVPALHCNWWHAFTSDRLSISSFLLHCFL